MKHYIILFFIFLNSISLFAQNDDNKTYKFSIKVSSESKNIYNEPLKAFEGDSIIIRIDSFNTIPKNLNKDNF
ncbi:MAG: hypothetical protein K8R54_12405 [Bacteroidales bacterium]|nr:hypothetical protein [Bacteroidales bacterium]